MSTYPHNPTSQFPLSLQDFLDHGVLEDGVMGKFECEGDTVMMAVVDYAPHYFSGPEVFEINEHTLLVLFHQTFFETVGDYIRAALANTPLEDETDMRIIGTFSQKAIVASIQWNAVNNR